MMVNKLYGKLSLSLCVSVFNIFDIESCRFLPGSTNQNPSRLLKNDPYEQQADDSFLFLRLYDVEHHSCTETST